MYKHYGRDLSLNLWAYRCPSCGAVPEGMTATCKNGCPSRQKWEEMQAEGEIEKAKGKWYGFA